MSVEDFKADVARNIAELKKDPTLCVDQATYFANTIWPMFEAAGETMEELEDEMIDVLEGNADVLHAENAQVFAQLIVIGRQVFGKLMPRLGPQLKKAAEHWLELSKNAEQILAEITVQDAPEDDDEDVIEDEEDDEDEDEEDDDDEEGDEAGGQS
jgi:hypothetical protein